MSKVVHTERPFNPGIRICRIAGHANFRWDHGDGNGNSLLTHITNNNMQFLHSASSSPNVAQSLYILLPLADLLHPSPAQLPGEYTPVYTFQGARSNLSTIAIAIYRQVYSFTAEWTEASLSLPVAHAGGLLMSQLACTGLEPTILWLGVRRVNHLAIGIPLEIVSHQTKINYLCEPISGRCVSGLSKNTKIDLNVFKSHSLKLITELV